MPKVTGPHIRDLTQEESMAVLGAHNVGRIAFTLHDRVDIAPVNYVSDGQWIFGRTSAGAKLGMLLHNPWCAFETDVIGGLFDWTSIVVKGTFSLLDPAGGSPDTYATAERLLAQLVDGTFTEHDPAPRRNIVFGIFVREISGRTATP
jgi:nitroimidazol reductase NimA-like FMN-containing flavoprotein (pyridoxamine 5'-phosphate oxidase superfamily)